MQALSRYVETRFLKEGTGWLAVFLPIALVLGNTASDIVASVIASLFLFDKIKTRDFTWVQKPWVMAGLTLWAYASLRGLWAEHPGDSFYHAVVWIRFLLFAVAMVSWVISETKWRDRLFVSLLGITMFLSLDTIMQYLVGFDIIGNKPTVSMRMTSVYSRPIVGIMMANLFFPVLALFLEKKKLLLGFGYAVLCLIAIIMTGERLASILAVVGVICFGVLGFRKNVYFRWGLLILAIGVPVFFINSPGLYQRHIYQTQVTIENLAASHYGVIWQASLDVAKENPIFGVGVHHFRTVSCTEAEFASISPSRCGLHSHNNYLEWLAEGGLVGLVLFVGLVFSLAWVWVKGFLGANRHNAVFLMAGAYLALRFFPLVPVTSFFHSWAAIPLWLMIAWAMAEPLKKAD